MLLVANALELLRFHTVWELAKQHLLRTPYLGPVLLATLNLLPWLGNLVWALACTLCAVPGALCRWVCCCTCACCAGACCGGACACCPKQSFRHYMRDVWSKEGRCFSLCERARRCGCACGMPVGWQAAAASALPLLLTSLRAGGNKFTWLQQHPWEAQQSNLLVGSTQLACPHAWLFCARLLNHSLQMGCLRSSSTTPWAWNCGTCPSSSRQRVSGVRAACTAAACFWVEALVCAASLLPTARKPFVRVTVPSTPSHARQSTAPLSPYPPVCLPRPLLPPSVLAALLMAVTGLTQAPVLLLAATLYFFLASRFWTVSFT